MPTYISPWSRICPSGRVEECLNIRTEDGRPLNRLHWHSDVMSGHAMIDMDHVNGAISQGTITRVRLFSLRVDPDPGSTAHSPGF